MVAVSEINCLDESDHFTRINDREVVRLARVIVTERNVGSGNRVNGEFTIHRDDGGIVWDVRSFESFADDLGKSFDCGH